MRALLFLLVFALSGCIVFAPGFDPVEQCPIHGDSLCGTCIRTKCQAEVNNCCGAKDCRETGFSSAFTDNTEQGSTIAALDVCAADGTKCSNALSGAQRSPESTAVNTCIANSCKDDCNTVGSSTVPVTQWTCATAATDNACDQCIHTSCGDELGDCCVGTTCASSLGKEMTACTSGDAAGCSKMKDGSAAGKEGVVRKCVKNNCSAECFGNGFPHQQCSLQGGGDYCACYEAETPSGDECSTSAVPGSRCFFTGGGCICGHYACKQNLTATSYQECSCTLTNGTDSGSCDPSDFTDTDQANCCLSVGSSYEGPSCRCSTLGVSCRSDEIEVYSCAKASFASAMSERRTSSCSQ